MGSPWCLALTHPRLSSPNAGVSPSRFQGQETWFCADRRGKYSSDFLQLRDVPVVAIDLSGSVLNYNGLDNLGEKWMDFRGGRLSAGSLAQLGAL